MIVTFLSCAQCKISATFWRTLETPMEWINYGPQGLTVLRIVVWGCSVLLCWQRILTLCPYIFLFLFTYLHFKEFPKYVRFPFRTYRVWVFLLRETHLVTRHPQDQLKEAALQVSPTLLSLFMWHPTCCFTFNNDHYVCVYIVYMVFFKILFNNYLNKSASPSLNLRKLLEDKTV